MKIHNVISGTLASGSITTTLSMLSAVSALYINHGVITDANEKLIRVQLTKQSKNSGNISIVDADLYSLMQYADMSAGAGYEKEAESFGRLTLGRHTCENGEQFELKITCGAQLLTSNFILVEDSDSGFPIRYQGFDSQNQYSAPNMLALVGFGASGKTFQIQGDDGYSIAGNEALIIGKANSKIEVVADIDTALIYIDSEVEGKSISVTCSSAIRLLSVERV